jgi:hypothetical protein
MSVLNEVPLAHVLRLQVRPPRTELEPNLTSEPVGEDALPLLWAARSGLRLHHRVLDLNLLVGRFLQREYKIS